MNEEIFRIYQTSAKIIALAASVLIFVKFSFALGLLLGCACLGIYTFILVVSSSALIDKKGEGYAKFAYLYPLKLFALAFPFLIAALFPETVNFFGVLVALFIFKGTILLRR